MVSHIQKSNCFQLFNVLLLFIFFLFPNFLISQNLPPSNFDPNLKKIIAFPGAEGFGKYTIGGRGGQILKVTNLNDDGPGSLRAAIETRGPRIIIFEVSGNIKLKSNLQVRYGYLTIAGQTAPGEGITIQNYPLMVMDVENVIIRFIRSRMGDIASIQGDAFDSRGVKNMIVDHCSFSWGTDETCTVYGVENVTIQNSIISEGLNRNTIISNSDHGFGSILGGNNLSFYNNLMAHFQLRSPSISNSSNISDLRNNVIYNWSQRSMNNGANAKANIYANYNKPGPATKMADSNVPNNFLWPTGPDYGKFYLEGNKIFGNNEIDNNQWAGVRLETGDLTKKYLENLKNKDSNGKLVPFPVPNELYSVTRSADNAYQFVLSHAGASLFRDAVDTRIVQEVKNGTATFKGSKTGLLGIIDSQNDVGGWPTLKSFIAPKDSDGDGMPDTWEIANNIDPKIANDKEYSINPYYTNIEMYLNSLVQGLVDLQNPGVPKGVNLVLPNNNQSVSPVEVSFVWQPIINASQYQIQISKTSDFSSGVININNIKNNSIVYPDLDPINTYFWRVRAINNSGNGAYSSVYTFKTSGLNISPGKTVLLHPEENGMNTSLSPKFIWAKVPNANSYQIQISTDANFSTLILNQSSIVENEFSSPKLAENRTYYWRIRARNDFGTGSYSATGIFKTLSLSNTPLPIVSISPVNQILVSPININLKWMEEPSATTYQIQIATDYNFSNILLDKNNHAGIFLNIPNLDPDKSYFWRIRGLNRSGVGRYSAVNQFKTSAFPSAPQQVELTSPENGSNVFDSKITFQWKEEPIAQSYRIQVSTSPSFSNFISNVGNLNNNIYTVSNLQPNTQYYWRVIASNEAGAAPASEIRKVRTASYSGTPGATTLISPENQSVVGINAVTFNWTNQPNTEYYRLEISEQFNFSTYAYIKNSIPGTSYTVQGLLPNKTYYWRIRTSNPSGLGERSEIWMFSSIDQNINLSPPILLLPKRAENFLNPEINFSWEKVTEAESYHLQVSKSADFAVIEYQNQTISNPNFNLSSLVSGSAYFWRVRAKKNSIFSAWSDTWNFAIGSTDNILDNGLVGYWTMEEGSGNKMLDVSGKNNHATIQNTTNVKWIEGKTGKAISLDGGWNRYATISHNSSLNIDNAVTLAAWVKPSQLQRGHIFYKNGGNGFELWLDNDGKVEFRLNRGNNGSTYRIKSNFNYAQSIGKWIHIAATFDGNTCKLYINGNEDTSKNYASFKIGTTSANLVIGAMADIQRWRGELDELRLYERALSANEILLLKDHETIIPPSSAPQQSGNLIGHWKMDEGNGSKMIDHSGNNLHATIQNSDGIFWTNGKQGQAISMSGGWNRFGLVSHQSVLKISNSLTLTAWVKPNQIHKGHIFYKNDGNGFELWLDQDGKIEFRLNRGNNGITYKMKSNFNYSDQVGKWIHIAATFDGSTMKLFINGRMDVTSEYDPFVIDTNSGDLVIGAMGNIQRWRGELDELRIYGTSLGENEISNLVAQNETFRIAEETSKFVEEAADKSAIESKNKKILIENEEKITAKLFPNPVENQVQISPIWLEEGLINIMIYDLKGSLIVEKEAEVSMKNLMLDIGNLKLMPGTYMLLIQDSKHRQIFRFIKN